MLEKDTHVTSYVFLTVRGYTKGSKPGCLHIPTAVQILAVIKGLRFLLNTTRVDRKALDRLNENPVHGQEIFGSLSLSPYFVVQMRAVESTFTFSQSVGLLPHALVKHRL